MYPAPSVSPRLRRKRVRPVHHRIPLILSPADYAAWIDRGNEEVGCLSALLRPFPADAMEARAVGPLVNNPRYDGPECLAAPVHP